jgi:ubiquinone/menaquinone biosynthesis C-methylase UbiE
MKEGAGSEAIVGENADHDVIAGFGDEWSRFDQSGMEEQERRELFDAYFAIFPWERIGPSSVGFDLGCGSGRWAALVARRVGLLHCIDPAEPALEVARRNLASERNVAFHLADAGSIPLADGSADFGYSLGVLHHVPDTRAALAAAVRKLRPGAPFLLYLYYAFDNRPRWFRLVWRASEAGRFVVSRAPHPLRYAMSQAIAAGVYWPLARIARAAERLGVDVGPLPLSAYRHRSFYVMRTDALDRFGTRLEQRFTRAEIEGMMRSAGLDDIRFHSAAPFWCAVGVRR